MIIVGFYNPHEDCDALDPKPGTSGERLWKMSGLSLEKYMRVPRTNLIEPDSDPHDSPRTLALELMDQYAGSYADVVLLGREVWRAFFPDREVVPFKYAERASVRYYYVPHPSGLNRYYNVKRNVGRVRTLFAELLPAKKRRPYLTSEPAPLRQP